MGWTKTASCRATKRQHSCALPADRVCWCGHLRRFLVPLLLTSHPDPRSGELERRSTVFGWEQRGLDWLKAQQRCDRGTVLQTDTRVCLRLGLCVRELGENGADPDRAVIPDR